MFCDVVLGAEQTVASINEQQYLCAWKIAKHQGTSGLQGEKQDAAEVHFWYNLDEPLLDYSCKTVKSCWITLIIQKVSDSPCLEAK